jgi:DNA helicase II / ATP-dependent DNA helicase PcrA
MTDQLQSMIQQLNEQQQEAVLRHAGSSLIIAGAGSGKTRVITTRILNLIMQHEVHPTQILALTFTNKAAQEMRERILSSLPPDTYKPMVATFHSFCLQLLKRNIAFLPYDTFSVLDSQDQLKLLQTIVKKFNLEKRFNVKQLLFNMSQYKNSKQNNNDVISAFPDHKLFLEIYNAYQHEKTISKCLDFDDLILEVVKLLKTNQTFKDLFQSRTRHVLIDEYQDTNHTQHELLKLMCLNKEGALAVDSVCAVGDEDQSIYSWRGATVTNILTFHKDFPDTKTLKIEQNYRSTQHILDVAHHVIQNNSQRSPKKLWSDKKCIQKTIELECSSDYQESDAIVGCIEAVSKIIPDQTSALLYRTHYQSRILEEGLIKASIPYNIIGGIKFYERKEVKDLIAYLRLMSNPFDRVSLLRVINCPKRTLGPKFEELMLNTWNENPFFTFKELLQHLIMKNCISDSKQKAVKSFLEAFEGIDEKTSPTDAINQVVTKVGYISYLKDQFSKEEAQTKKENVYELVRAITHFEKQTCTTITKLLDEIALMQDKLSKTTNNSCVQLMTLHSAKGLEFDTVIISGLEDGMLPSNPAIQESNVEEERRLFYVGITRARQRLLLTHAKFRNSFGQTNSQFPSRFLEEIPNHLTHQQSSNRWSKKQFVTYFTSWITSPGAPPVPRNSFAQAYAYPNQANTSSTPTRSPFATSAGKPKMNNRSGSLKRLQSVKHTSFGLGIAQKIERIGDKTYVTVLFSRHGKKKIESSFLKTI